MKEFPKITAAISNLTSKEIAAWALKHLDGAKLDPKWGKSVMLKKAQNIIDAMKKVASCDAKMAEPGYKEVVNKLAHKEPHKPDVHKTIHEPAKHKSEHPKTELQTKLEAKGFSKELVKPAKAKKERGTTSKGEGKDEYGFLKGRPRSLMFAALIAGTTKEELTTINGGSPTSFLKNITQPVSSDSTQAREVVVHESKDGVLKITSYKLKEPQHA